MLEFISRIQVAVLADMVGDIVRIVRNGQVLDSILTIGMRDRVVLGGIPTPDGRIPMSDGAGDVVAVGEGVTRFKVGSMARMNFLAHFLDGDVPKGEPERRVRLIEVLAERLEGGSIEALLDEAGVSPDLARF